MARIKALENRDVSQETKLIFSEIEANFGITPNIFRTMAHFPPLLKANWEKVKAVMMQGNLSRKVKETIAVLISKDNSCQYCVGAHTMWLKAIGVTEKEIENINNIKLEEAGFDKKEIALILFAQKVNTQSNQITKTEFDELIKLGASEHDIVETLGVMELFTAFNKFINALEVDLDF